LKTIYDIIKGGIKLDLKVAGIVDESIVDGPGIRLVIFVQGCIHLCKGCHNEKTHSLNGGTLVDIDTIIDRVKKNPLLDGVTFSGGEPFLQAKPLSILAKKIKALGYNVITYTGYTFEFIMDNIEKYDSWEDLINHTDILIDGQYEENKRNLTLPFRGSENQRIINVIKSLEIKDIVQISELS
jgi:anaerobic ribonucleoside-triphosphate reductase activating protein